jgi:glycosyltransferase involved in cell wall biosynthesis
VNERYLGKIIYVVHCFQWYHVFYGNRKKFQQWIEQQKDLHNTPYYCERLMHKFADHIICVTEHAKKELIDDFAIEKGKITTIYNGLPEKEVFINEQQKEKLKKELGFKKSDKLILFVGRLFVIKGVNELLKAFQKVFVKEPDAHLILIGDGEFNLFLPNCIGIWRNVHFTGLLPREKVFDFYRIADVGVLPSWFEWCSFVALEMMQMKLPIVTTNVGGLDELFVHQKSAYKIIVKYNSDGSILIDTDQLASYLLNLLNSNDKAKMFGSTAYYSFIKRHTTNSMTAQTLSTYSNQFNEK